MSKVAKQGFIILTQVPLFEYFILNEGHMSCNTKYLTGYSWNNKEVSQRISNKILMLMFDESFVLCCHTIELNELEMPLDIHELILKKESWILHHFLIYE